MQGNTTFTMIKPDAMQHGDAGKIIDLILKNGFRIIAMKMLQLSTSQAGLFYKVHQGRPFYHDLVAFMSSGPIIAMALEKDKAVEAYRNLIGPTDPSKAEAPSLRFLFGTSIQENAVHGSDADDTARQEIGFFFNQFEQV